MTKRRNKKSKAVLRDTSENRNVSGGIPDPTIQQGKLRSINWLLRVVAIVLIPTIGAYFGLVEYFRSKLTLEVQIQDKENALHSRFKIQNQGSLTLSQIENWCDVLDLKLDIDNSKNSNCRGFDIYGMPAIWCIRGEEGARLEARNASLDEGYVYRDLEPGETDTDQMCKNPLIPLPAFLNEEGRKIEIRIPYRLPWIALQSEKRFRFELLRDPEGTLTWFPISKARQ